jgi:hypothetical protein
MESLEALASTGARVDEEILIRNECPCYATMGPRNKLNIGHQFHGNNVSDNFLFVVLFESFTCKFWFQND